MTRPIMVVDSELIRSRLRYISEQTGILITEDMIIRIEGLLVDSPDITELETLSLEMAKCNIHECSWLDSHYDELRENKKQIKYRSLALNRKISYRFTRKKNLVRNKNCLQRRNKNSRYGK